MKRVFPIIALVLFVSIGASAQQEKKWTVNTRAWSTNYWTSLIVGVAESTVKHLVFKGHKADSLWAERILPDPDLVFPIGMGKEGFEHRDIYGPYHYAFGNPFKHIGDYGIGADVSYKVTNVVGVYAGAYFKSQEIVFRDTKDNLRGFYFQPRFGLMAEGDDIGVEAGVFYDALADCGGSEIDTNKSRLKSGWGFDCALTSSGKKSKMLLQLSVPLHNFLNDKYAGQEHMKRKVGYIILTERVYL